MDDITEQSRIHVAARIRPCSSTSSAQQCVKIDSKKPVVWLQNEDNEQKEFEFDTVLSADAQQVKNVKELIPNFFSPKFSRRWRNVLLTVAWTATVAQFWPMDRRIPVKRTRCRALIWAPTSIPNTRVLCHAPLNIYLSVWRQWTER